MSVFGSEMRCSVWNLVKTSLHQV